jgi:hypothetical protein
LVDSESHQIYDCTVTGLGTLRAIPIHLISNNILTLLEPHDLLVASLVSHAFYVLCEDDRIWKRLVICKYGGKFKFRDSWKRTYFLRRTDTVDRPLVRIEVKGKSRPTTSALRASIIPSKGSTTPLTCGRSIAPQFPSRTSTRIGTTWNAEPISL